MFQVVKSLRLHPVAVELFLLDVEVQELVSDSSALANPHLLVLHVLAQVIPLTKLHLSKSTVPLSLSKTNVPTVVHHELTPKHTCSTCASVCSGVVPVLPLVLTFLPANVTIVLHSRFLPQLESKRDIFA